MALKKTLKIKDNFGIEITFDDAYIKVIHIHGTKDSLTAHVGIHIKKDEIQIDSKVFEFSLTLDGKNFIAQAYDHLKTMPEFAGAIDC
jgi:hypothetical protein